MHKVQYYLTLALTIISPLIEALLPLQQSLECSWKISNSIFDLSPSTPFSEFNFYYHIVSYLLFYSYVRTVVI